MLDRIANRVKSVAICFRKKKELEEPLQRESEDAADEFGKRLDNLLLTSACKEQVGIKQYKSNYSTKGNHVRVLRPGLWHHGIDIGDGTVVHFTSRNVQNRTFGWHSLSFNKSRMCVLRTNIEEFYGESYIIEIVDHKLKPRRRKKVADAAVSSIGRGGYNIAINNCEHFALSCVYESAKDFDAEDQIKEISNRYRTFEMDVPFIWMPIKSLIMKSTAIYSVVRMRLRQAYHFRKKTLAGQLQAIIEEEVDRLSASTIRDVKVSRFENFFWIVFFVIIFPILISFAIEYFSE